MSTIDCARAAFELEYSNLAARASKACRRVPRASRADAIQEWLAQFWERYLEFCIADGITDIDIARAAISAIRNSRSRQFPVEDNWESLEIPSYLNPIDGILVAGFVQGDSDSELSAVTDIPRRSIPGCILASLERAVPVLTLHALLKRLARLESSAPREISDIAELTNYIKLRVSLIGE